MEYIPCWNEDSEGFYEEFKKFQDPEVVRKLLESLDIDRRAKLESNLANMNFTHSSRRVWSILSRFGNSVQRHSVTDMDPNRILSKLSLPN